MNYDFAKCKFTAAELKGESVYARVQLENDKIYEGESEFDAIQNQEGLVRLAVIIHIWEKDMSAVNSGKIFVPSEAFDKIVRNPPESKCEFSFNEFEGDFKDISDPYDWTDSRFKADEINEKHADVVLRGNDGNDYSGFGVVQAITKKNLISKGSVIRVRIAYFPTSAAKYYQVPSKDSHKLVKNPEGSKSAFSFKDL